jgi:diaminopimelate decarboxylase
MNDLLRPALYQAHHQIVPVVQQPGVSLTAVDLVGPVCESADTFAQGVELPPMQAGDLVVLRTAGAYGFAMSSNYNTRPRAAEVLVEGGACRLVRRRETIEELFALERDPA